MEQNPRIGNTSGSSGGAQRKKSKGARKKPGSLNEEQLTGAQCVAEIKNAFDPVPGKAHQMKHSDSRKSNISSLGGLNAQYTAE